MAPTAGQSYYIGAYVGSGLEYYLNNEVTGGEFAASSADITLIAAAQKVGSFGAPLDTLGFERPGRWGAANAVVAIPEPSSIGLLAILPGLLVLRRR